MFLKIFSAVHELSHGEEAWDWDTRSRGGREGRGAVGGRAGEEARVGEDYGEGSDVPVHAGISLNTQDLL